MYRPVQQYVRYPGPAYRSNLIRRLPEYHCLSGLHDKRLFLSGIQLAGTPESLSSSLKEEESGP